MLSSANTMMKFNIPIPSSIKFMQSLLTRNENQSLSFIFQHLKNNQKTIFLLNFILIEIRILPNTGQIKILCTSYVILRSIVVRTKIELYIRQ